MSSCVCTCAGHFDRDVGGIVRLKPDLLGASVRREALASAENPEWEGREFFEFSAMECKKVQQMKL